MDPFAPLKRRSFLGASAMATLTTSLATSAVFAKDDEFPKRPVKILVAGPAGGPLDAAARILSRRLQDVTGQPFVVDNRPGAAGSIAAKAVALAEPDGYTLLAGFPSPISVNPHLYSNLGYKADDFAGVGLISTMPMALVVPANSPIKSMEDLVRVGKRPKPPFFGSAGNGALSHLAGIVFNNSAGTSFGHAPYKGGPPLALALLSGEVGWSFLDAGNAKPLIADGRLRALAVSTGARTPLWPTVPSMSEQGFKDINIGVWFGLLAPAKTPRATLNRLNVLLTGALTNPTVQSELRGIGNEPVTGQNSPEEFARLIAQESSAYAKAVRTSGLRVE